jgi:hypothetical protein
VLCAIDGTGPPVPATPRASDSGVCSAERENETKSFGILGRLDQVRRAVTLEKTKGERTHAFVSPHPLKFFTTLALRHGRHDANAFHTPSATHRRTQRAQRRERLRFAEAISFRNAPRRIFS